MNYCQQIKWFHKTKPLTHIKSIEAKLIQLHLHALTHCPLPICPIHFCFTVNYLYSCMESIKLITAGGMGFKWTCIPTVQRRMTNVFRIWHCHHETPSVTSGYFGYGPTEIRLTSTTNFNCPMSTGRFLLNFEQTTNHDDTNIHGCQRSRIALQTENPNTGDEVGGAIC